MVQLGIEFSKDFRIFYRDGLRSSLVENKWYIAGTKNYMQQKTFVVEFFSFQEFFCNFRRPDTTIESIYLQSSFQHEFKSAMRLDTAFVENTTLNMFFFQLG